MKTQTMRCPHCNTVQTLRKVHITKFITRYREITITTYQICVQCGTFHTTKHEKENKNPQIWD
jgi:hypothetical protein